MSSIQELVERTLVNFAGIIKYPNLDDSSYGHFSLFRAAERALAKLMLSPDRLWVRVEPVMGDGEKSVIHDLNEFVEIAGALEVELRKLGDARYILLEPISDPLVLEGDLRDKRTRRVQWRVKLASALVALILLDPPAWFADCADYLPEPKKLAPELAEEHQD